MMPAAAASGCSSSVPSLPPPRPKSPPEYPDLYGKRRETAKVQMLEREIGFLEEELKSVQRLQPASRCCKEVTDYVVAKADPLMPTNRKNRRSCRFWKWLCGVPCFNFSWICCCCYSGGSLQLELPRCCDGDCNLCSCPSCGSCCPSCDSCCPSCGSCFPSCGNCCPSCGSCCPSCGSCFPSCGSCFPSCGSCCPSCGSCCPSCGSCPSCVSCPAPKWRCCSCPHSNCCKNISCSRKCCVFQFPSCPDCSCSCRWKCSCPKFPKVSLCCNCRKCCCNPCSCNPCCPFF